MTVAMQAVAHSDSGRVQATNALSGGRASRTLKNGETQIELFSPEEKHSDAVAKSLLLMSWVTNGLVRAHHWPKEPDKLSEYRAAAKEFLLQQPYICDPDPVKASANLARAFALYKERNGGPAHVGEFLKKGKWPENKRGD